MLVPVLLTVPEAEPILSQLPPALVATLADQGYAFEPVPRLNCSVCAPGVRPSLPPRTIGEGETVSAGLVTFALTEILAVSVGSLVFVIVTVPPAWPTVSPAASIWMLVERLPVPLLTEALIHDTLVVSFH
jgi:hypothetical protein